MKAIPEGVPANFISILSHFSVYLALYLSYSGGSAKAGSLLIPSLILLHLIADKMDGIRARNTGTDSPLGELIDHFFEVFNAGAIIFIAFHWFGFAHLWILIVAVSSTLLVSMAKFYEQYKNNIRIIDELGLFELKILLMTAILFSYFPQVYEFLHLNVAKGYSIIESVFMIAILGGLLSFVRTFQRISHATYGFWLFIFLLLVVLATSVLVFDVALASIVILLYGGLYIGNLLIGQLIDGAERSPGLFTPLFLIIHLATGYFNPQNTFLILVIYLLVNLLLAIFRGFRALKGHWQWWLQD
ncbi:CDP-alcohol phosphatidyltransferase family protein [Fulvivirga imtechensis]|nr:CDP-alcohol phosphatidyltransferase family protein [Fulvivirga imtechensis]